MRTRSADLTKMNNSIQEEQQNRPEEEAYGDSDENYVEEENHITNKRDDHMAAAAFERAQNFRMAALHHVQRKQYENALREHRQVGQEYPAFESSTSKERDQADFYRILAHKPPQRPRTPPRPLTAKGA